MEELTEMAVDAAATSKSSSLNSSRWKLSEDIHGPALASFISLEFLLALIFNTYIIGHSIYHRATSFKRSSTILLFSLAMSDLVMVMLYMPFVIAASSSGEWIFGRTDGIRNVLCQMHGFVFFYASTVSTYILAVISVDRCLYIVKGDIHHRIMTRRVVNAVMATIWVRMYLVLMGLMRNIFYIIACYNTRKLYGNCISRILLMSA